MKKLILILTVLALTGCAATQKEMAHSALMYDKQIAATKAAVPTPIFQMTALPGQTIELKGVQQISVYNPSDATNKVPAPVAKTNEALQWGKLLVEGGLGFMGLRVNLAKFGIDASRTISAGDKDVIREGMSYGNLYNENPVPEK